MEEDEVTEDGIEGVLLEQDGWNCSEWSIPKSSSNASPRETVDSSSGVSDDEEESQEPERGDNQRSDDVQNEYIRSILDGVDLHILQPGRVQNAISSENPEADLFHLFLSKDYLGAVCTWTNEGLVSRGRKPCVADEFLAYVGLELGMSLLKYNSIHRYWSKGSFLGHETFRATMSRTRFQEIRSAVRFESRQSYGHNVASHDPLWSCRGLLDQFMKKSATVAVPLGVSALDENSCPTKARTKAKTYSPNKPAKYAIRFYAVVGHKYCYLSAMADNRAGNTTGIAAVYEYFRLFRNMRTPYNQIIAPDKSKDSLAETPSALWITMMAHQVKTYQQPNGGKRYFFCDNYYTRHTIAKTLLQFTDGKAHIIGTVKFTNVDGTNRYYLSRAIETLKDASRGSWAVVQVFNKHRNYDQLRGQHAAQQRRVPAKDRTPFVPPLDSVAERTGYIVFKDSKVVLFYSNDLVQTPPEAILLHHDERAVQCVGGLAKISRWTGSEVLHRTDFYVAAPIVAYNMFMNGVDRMDQYRATLATQRKEKRIYMTIFTFVLDLSISQGYAIYQKAMSSQNRGMHPYFEFKRRICQSLIKPWNMSKVSPSTARPSETDRVTIASSLGVISESHMLVENLPRNTNPNKPQDLDCFLCRRMGREVKTIYSCIQCRKGFHVNCFAAFHYRGQMSRRHTALLDVVFDTDEHPTVGKPSKYAPTSTAHMQLACEKESMFTRALTRTKANATANAKRRSDNKELRARRKEMRFANSSSSSDSNT